MNNDLKEAITLLAKEKNISKDSLLEAIRNGLISACNKSYGTSENVTVEINPETCDYIVYQNKEVVDKLDNPTILDDATKISLAKAKMIEPSLEVGDIVGIELKSREFGRIAAQVAKNVIFQKIKEEERRVIFNDFYTKERDILVGTISRINQNNGGITVNFGKCDGVMPEPEQVPTEKIKYRIGARLRVYVVEVKESSRGPRIMLSRNRADFVKRLFERVVPEITDGTVEIRSIAREAGSRTKMAVYSNNPDVDPIGTCVGVSGGRVDDVIDELMGEKIDIIEWSDNVANLIENSLSPAKVICVLADEEAKEAQVIVPDYQLSLAIGKEGQNVRLAAKLTNYKIDIKSESQARESGLWDELGIDYQAEGTQDLEEVAPDNDDTDIENS